jgi:hypothetical protein
LTAKTWAVALKKPAEMPDIEVYLMTNFEIEMMMSGTYNPEYPCPHNNDELRKLGDCRKCYEAHRDLMFEYSQDFE